MKYISRHMETKILKLGKSYSAILLTGPRQVVKTTMLRSLVKKANIGSEYVSPDNLNICVCKGRSCAFLQLYKTLVLIDEVQYASQLFTYIKIYIDDPAV